MPFRTTTDVETHAMSAGNKAYTIKEFCRTFGVSRTLTYREIGIGKLKARKAGRRTLILVADAEDWAQALPHALRKTLM
jgi:hypothetical protein